MSIDMCYFLGICHTSFLRCFFETVEENCGLDVIHIFGLSLKHGERCQGKDQKSTKYA